MTRYFPTLLLAVAVTLLLLIVASWFADQMVCVSSLLVESGGEPVTSGITCR